MSKRRADYPQSTERRAVIIPDAHWMALKLIADLNYCSVSAVLREAAERYVERYGLTITDGELSINEQLWPTEVIQRQSNAGAEIFEGDQAEICEGDQDLPGGPS